jgi:hypothetical protein
MVPAGDPTEQTVTRSRNTCSRATRSSTAATPISKTTFAARRRSRDAAFTISTSDERRRLGRRARVLPDDRRPEHAATRLIPIFRTLAPGQGQIPPSRGLDTSKTTAHEGFLYCGPSGAGHFVKMIHNGIEYGLMQSFAEGFDILRNASAETLPEEHRYH